MSGPSVVKCPQGSLYGKRPGAGGWCPHPQHGYSGRMRVVKVEKRKGGVS